MKSPELENLAGIGRLKREPPSRSEFDGLVKSGEARLSDAERIELSPESYCREERNSAGESTGIGERGKWSGLHVRIHPTLACTAEWYWIASSKSVNPESIA